MSTQNKWLEKVRDVSITPLEVAKEYFNKDRYTPGKSSFWNGNGIWDHRSVGANEVIFETDGTYSYNVRFKEQIEQALREEGIPYYTFFTGGKSFHIHCWFEKIRFTSDNNRRIAKEAVKAGFMMRDIRKWLIRKICANAGILDDQIGDGKVIDTAPINFVDGKRKLIRAAGGKKQEWDKKHKATRYCHYKTYIDKDTKLKKKPIASNINEVRYPTQIHTFTLDEYEVIELMDHYLKHVEKRTIADEKLFDGKYCNLHGVTKIMDGLEVGKRSAGAQILAIACVLDELTREETSKIMHEYVEACEQIGHEFTHEEAMQWYEWVCSQPSHFWNCSLLKEIDCHETYQCQFCMSQHKEANELLNKKDILKSVEHALSQMVAGERKLAMSEYILFNSRHFKTDDEWMLPNDPVPQAMIIVSDSSSGKSFVTKQVLKLFPEEYIMIRSRLTKSVLNYMINQDYDGKIIFIEELQGFDETSNQLRLWISEGILRLHTVEDVKLEDGTTVKEEVLKETTGQPVIITTTAQDRVDRELMNRIWVLSTDLSKEQTKTIMEYQDRMERGLYPKGIELEIQRLRDLQHELKPFHFLVPFMDMNLLKIPYSDIKVRRDYKKLVTMIKCVALLYQRQRIIAKDLQDREYIVCSFEDFQNAIRYIDENMEATFNGLSAEQVGVLQELRNNFGGSSPEDIIEFDLSDVQRVTSRHYQKCYTVMKTLENFGFVRTERGEKNRAIFTLVKNKELQHLNLPTFNELKNMFDFDDWFRKNDDFSFLFFSGSPLFTPKKVYSVDDNNQKCLEVLAAYGVEKTGKSGTPPEKQKTQSESRAGVKAENGRLPVFENSKCGYRENFRLYKGEDEESKKRNIMQNPRLRKTEKTENVIIGESQIPTKNKVTSFIKESKNNPVPFEELNEIFKNEKELEIVLNALKREGDIFETKPGRYVIL